MISDTRIDNVSVSAVQIQAAQLEVRLRESLGEPVDARLRRIAEAELPVGETEQSGGPNDRPRQSPPIQGPVSGQERLSESLSNLRLTRIVPAYVPEEPFRPKINSITFMPEMPLFGTRRRRERLLFLEMLRQEVLISQVRDQVISEAAAIEATELALGPAVDLDALARVRNFREALANALDEVRAEWPVNLPSTDNDA